MPKIALSASFLFLLYLILPFYLAAKGIFTPLRLILLYATLIIVSAIIVKRYLARRYEANFLKEEILEKANVLNISVAKAAKDNLGLAVKVGRYEDLKNIIEELNDSLELDKIADKLCEIAFAQVSRRRGSCLLYLVDPKTHRLSLFKSKKQENGLVLKAKEGDIFDFWVARHGVGLIIEDIRNDYRFDMDRLKKQDQRIISSVVSAPLLTDHTFLGLLRADNPAANSFDQDDLRFMAALCDLAAVAIENSQLFQRARELAIHDSLTSLYTKGYFLERLKEESLRALRQKSEFSLLMADIDFFKDYNDKFGHTAGDIVLEKVGRTMLDCMKEHSPFVSRFGGEEFCIILPGLGKKKAQAAAEELCKRISREKILLRRNETNITVSVGVANFPSDAASEDELIQKADHAMYRAKEKGRNRVCLA